MSEVCFFCGEPSPSALEDHHLVPQRHGGSDEPENMVTVCGSCHNKLESLYDRPFYERLSKKMGMGSKTAVKGQAGVELDPAVSMDAELRLPSEHFRVERWCESVNIVDVKAAAAEVNKLDENAEYVLSEYERFMDGYDNEVRTKRRELKQHQRQLDSGEIQPEEDAPAPNTLIDLETGVPFVRYVYEPNDPRTNPYLRVMNYYDSDISGNTIESVYDLSYHGRESSINGGRLKEYPKYYRLHCGYCHTVFSQNQHSDLRRHLKIRHGKDVDKETVDWQPINLRGE